MQRDTNDQNNRNEPRKITTSCASFAPIAVLVKVIGDLIMEDVRKMNDNKEWARTIVSALKGCGRDNSPGIVFSRDLSGNAFRLVRNSPVYSIVFVHLSIGNAGSRLSLHCPQTSSIKTAWEHLPFKGQRNIALDPIERTEGQTLQKLDLDKWVFAANSGMVNTTNETKPSKKRPGRRPEDTQTRRQKR